MIGALTGQNRTFAVLLERGQALTPETILVILTCPPAAVAQECPFPDSVAVPDTLDPAGYFPLQVGNTWDYILRDQAFIGGLWRQVVETDTLIAGVAYSKVKMTNFMYDADEISQSSTTYQYIAATDTSIDHWGHGAVSMPRPFSAEFSSCSSGFLVSGGYNVPFQISIGDSSMTVDSAIVKAFEGDFGEWRYARDVGLVQAIGDPSLETQLLYARTDRFEGGTPIENLFNVTVSRQNEEVRSSELNLQSYPNPFHERLHIDVSARIGMDYHLEMLDVLGRVVANPTRADLVWSGGGRFELDTSGLPPGMYIIRFSTEQITLVRPVIRIGR